MPSGWGWEKFKVVCLENCREGHPYEGSINCPDGDIGWEGVYQTTADLGGYCTAWDSDAASLGLQDCTPEKNICTKLAARHLHKMSERRRADDEAHVVQRGGVLGLQGACEISCAAQC